MKKLHAKTIYKKHLLLLFSSIFCNLIFGQCVTEVWGGARHCIALQNDSTVWTWGAPGSLGDGTSVERDAPVQVHGANNVGFLTSVVHVMSGELFNFALKRNGTVWSWGGNGASGFTGTLGDGTTVASRNNAVQVVGLDSAIALGGRGYHSLAIRVDSSVWGWGSNLGGAVPPGGGQLGMDTAVSHGSNVAIKINGITKHARQVTGGGFYSLVLLSDYTLVAFGNNYFGELGVGDTTSKHVPTAVVGLSNVIKVSGGWQHAVALKGDGTVWTWGKNQQGQLGTGDTLNRNVPTQVVGLSNVIAVSGGDYSTLALKADGTVWAWGGNERGECGDGTKITRKNPVQVSGLTNITYIAARDYHNVAIKADGTLWAWGWDLNGQCGTGSTHDTLWTPKQVQVLGLSCTTTTGIETIETSTQVKVYPNPANNIITVELGTKNEELQIVDLLGKEIMRLLLPYESLDIDISSLQPGVYFIKTKQDTKKFIKL